MTCLSMPHSSVHRIRVADHLGSQTPGDHDTRGALDNEELFVIEGSKTDPWRSAPENWRCSKIAQNAPPCLISGQ